MNVEGDGKEMVVVVVVVVVWDGRVTQVWTGVVYKIRGSPRIEENVGDDAKNAETRR